MDLSSIELKLIERQYKAVAEFQSDIILMFDNCRLYNGPDSGLSFYSQFLALSYHFVKALLTSFVFTSRFVSNLFLSFTSRHDLYAEYTDLADVLEKLFQKSLRSALIRKKKSASQSVRRKPGRPKKTTSKGRIKRFTA